MRRWILLAGLLVLPSSARAQVPLGPEFAVNAYTHRPQCTPDVGSDGLGRFVAVWPRWGEDDNGEGIFGQRFDDAERPLGAEFQVSTAGADVDQYAAPAIAVGADGRFVVAWSGDLFHPGIFARRFAPDGTPLAAVPSAVGSRSWPAGASRAAAAAGTTAPPLPSPASRWRCSSPPPSA